MAERFPAVFVSHGAPTLPIEASPAREQTAGCPRRRRDAPPPAWVTGFQEWLAHTAESGKTDDFLHYRERGPDAVRNHPSEEHFLPIFAAAGAGNPDVAGRRIHRSHTFGILAMDAYRFN